MRWVIASLILAVSAASAASAQSTSLSPYGAIQTAEQDSVRRTKQEDRRPEYEKPAPEYREEPPALNLSAHASLCEFEDPDFDDAYGTSLFAELPWWEPVSLVLGYHFVDDGERNRKGPANNIEFDMSIFTVGLGFSGELSPRAAWSFSFGFGWLVPNRDFDEEAIAECLYATYALKLYASRNVWLSLMATAVLPERTAEYADDEMDFFMIYGIGLEANF